MGVMTPTFLPDNHISVFQLDKQSIRGRAVHLGDALDRALGYDNGEPRYPEPVARLLGEAMLIGALVVKALKFKGRLIVQCHGTNAGAVSLLVADCNTEGHIRGYARWDDEQLTSIMAETKHAGAHLLLGGGTFSMTIDQGADMDQYQGLAAIEGERLSDCAEHYFKQSEQIPTHIRLACGQVQTPGAKAIWRGGGMLIQRIANDMTRGDTEEDWHTATQLFSTLNDVELLDPNLSQNDLLYRLFHEGGVRVIDDSPILAKCKCSRQRLQSTLKSFDKQAVMEMVKDGVITASCEFCGTQYAFSVDDI